MPLPTKSIRGISGIIQATHWILKLNGTFRATYVRTFNAEELAALDALVATAQAFSALVPLGDRETLDDGNEPTA